MAAQAEARGRESSPNLSPRKTLVTGRRNRSWQVSKGASATYSHHEKDQRTGLSRVGESYGVCRLYWKPR